MHWSEKSGVIYLQGTDRFETGRTTPIVTIVGDKKATIDDATWLYELNGTIYDIYGHTGDTEADAYQISTAYQLLSFAYEVKGSTIYDDNGKPLVREGNDFNGKYIRLDADLTLQPTADKTKAELDATVDGEESQLYNDAPNAIDWIGIGDAGNVFNGTFLGGKRFIYRLKGKPLFLSLGANARIEQLQVNTVNKPDGSSYAVDGSGMYANTNAGLICGCKVVGDVAFSESTVGAFVGTNESTGKVWCCYHVGMTMSTSTEETVKVGGLVGSNSGVIACCYHAGKVTGKSGATLGGITASSMGDNVYNNYYNSTLLSTNSSINGVTPKSSSDMTKQDFVNDLNVGITTWLGTHTTYHTPNYVYQPANYPKLNE